MLLLLPAALLHEAGEVRLGRRPPLARAFSRADERRELGGFDVLDVAERPQHQGPHMNLFLVVEPA